MGRSKDIATSAKGDADYVNVSGDTMTGNLGIGASPSQKLHVEGTGNQFILLNNSSTNDGMYLKAGTGASSIQTNAGSHVLNFFTSGTERMKIDSSGYVTTPSQPFIDCTGSSNSSHSYAQNDILTHFSTRSTPVGITLSNGRFTVPVAGRYLFNFNLYSYTTAEGHYRLQILVNGNIHSYAQIEVDAGMAVDAISNGYDHSIMNSTILNLSASDYVEIKTTGAIQYYRGIAHNSLSMMLLG